MVLILNIVFIIEELMENLEINRIYILVFGSIIVVILLFVIVWELFIFKRIILWKIKIFILMCKEMNIFDCFVEDF